MLESFRERWSAFTIEQKISVGLLSCCGIFVIGLSLYRIKENVNAPFLVNDSQTLAAKQIIGASDQENVDKLKRTDTDGDGLSDWDEINTFHTNPNLRDTCGDGIPDNIRVLTGKNISCGANTSNPGGMIDIAPVVSASSSMPNPQAMPLPQANIDMSQLMQVAGGASSTPAAAPTGGSLSGLPRNAAAIRRALQGSVDPAKLAQVSDEELLQLYDQAVQGAAATSTQP